MCALSVLIETAQFLVIPGRYSTIGDVITNSLGGALGFSIGLYAFVLLRPPSRRMALALCAGWSALWLAIQVVTAFGFSPAIPRSEYYGQLAPHHEDVEPFRGAVLGATIADVPLSDSRLSESPRLQEQLVRGAIVMTTVVPAGPTPDIAPIVRVVDEAEREIVFLGQNVPDLVFGVRTGAVVLRLRPPFFSQPDVFPGATRNEREPATDTLTASARYSASEVWMSTRTKTSHALRIPITSSLGWTMLLPFEWFIEGTRTERDASVIWVACLLLPIGYWGRRFVQFANAGRATRIQVTSAIIAALLYVGLVAVPRAFGVNPARFGDWLAAFTGLLLGAALAAGSSANRPQLERVVP
jgi:VanZ family protein